MAYTTSQFSAEYGLRILDNLQSYLETSTATALAAIDNALPDFVDYRTPTPIILNFPALFVSSSNTTIEQSDDDAYLTSEMEFYLDIAIDGVDTYTLQRSMLKYLLAVDRVIRSMTPEDLLGADWDTGGIVGPPIWEVTAHQFGVLRQADTIYRLDARIVLIVQILER
jgi:hypothetical protein